MARDSIHPNVPGLDTSFAALSPTPLQPATAVPVLTPRSRFAFDAAAGAVIAPLLDPFGSGSTFSTVGTVSAQLALSGGNIVRGSGAAVAGTEYAITILATAADGRTSQPTKIQFRAVLPLGGIPASAAPVLATLALTGTLTVGTAASGVIIVGTVAGSTVALSGPGAAGLTVSGSGTTRTISGTPTASGTLTAAETLAGATGSPKTSTLGTVASGSLPLPANGRMAYFGDSRGEQMITANGGNLPAPADIRAYGTHVRQRAPVRSLPEDVYSKSGLTSGQLISGGYHTAAAASGAGSICVLVGVNNAFNSSYTSQSDYGAATFASELDTILAPMLSAGMIIYLMDECPVVNQATANGGTALTAPQLALLAAQRDILRTKAQSNPQIIGVPTWNKLAAANDIGTPRGDVYRDNVHFSPIGAIEIADLIVARYRAPAMPFDLFAKAGNVDTGFVINTATTPPVGHSASAPANGTISHNVYTDTDGQVAWEITVAGFTAPDAAAATLIASPVNTALLAANGGPVTPGTTKLESALQVELKSGWSNFRNAQLGTYTTGGIFMKSDGLTNNAVAGGNTPGTPSTGGNAQDAADGGTTGALPYGGAGAVLKLNPWIGTVPSGANRVQRVLNLYGAIGQAATFTVKLKKPRFWLS